MRAGAFGAALALVVVCAANAEHLSVVRPDGRPVTDRLPPLPSLQEAVTSLSDLGGKYFYWCTEKVGESATCLDVLEPGRIVHVSLDRTHIDVITVRPGVGMTIDIGAITAVEVYDFPTMGETYEFAVKVAASQPGGNKAFWLRAVDGETAIRLATVFRSLPALTKGDLVSAAVTLGVAARDLSAGEAKAARVPGGVVIASVETGSLADQMTVQPGDYLLAIDGVPVNGFEDMKRRLASGALKSVTVWRTGKTLTLTVTSRL